MATAAVFWLLVPGDINGDAVDSSKRWRWKVEVKQLRGYETIFWKKQQPSNLVHCKQEGHLVPERQ